MSINTNTAARLATKELNEMPKKVNDTARNLKETVQSKVVQAGNQVGKKVELYKEKVSENLSGVAGKVHEKSDTAQKYLDTNAEKLNEYAHTAIAKVNQYGHKVGDTLENSSEFVKKIDFAETAQTIKSGIEKRPGTSIVVAGIFGLLIGLLIGRTR